MSLEFEAQFDAGDQIDLDCQYLTISGTPTRGQWAAGLRLVTKAFSKLCTAGDIARVWSVCLRIAAAF